MKENLVILLRSLGVAALLVLLPLAAGSLAPNQVLISLSETGTSALATSGDQLADQKMMMPNPFTYNYVAGDSLSGENGNGEVFELQLTGDPKNILKTVAAAVGVSGEVTESEYSSQQYPAFVIGPQDGTGPSAVINWSGTGNWWFNNPSAYPSPACLDFVTADDGSEYCGAYAEQKPTPNLLPSKTQMISEALKIFSATGHKVSEAEIETTIYEWGATASTSLKIGGQDSPIEWAVNWGSNGKIGSVSGNSVVAISRGDFPTISDRAAVSRMSDWRYSGQLAQSAWVRYQGNNGGRMNAFDDVASSKPSVDIPTGSTSPEESTELMPEPTPSTVTITIAKAIKSQVMIWDKTGKAWVVPGCILFGDQGWITPVFTLEEGIVELPEPMDVSPLVK